MSLKKSLFFFSILSFLSIPLGFLIRIFYSKTLTLEEFGLIYALISFFTFTSIFTRIGIEQSILYFFPKFIEKKRFDKIRNIFFSLTLLVLILNLLEGFVLLLFFNYLEDSFFKYSGIGIYLIIFYFYFIISDQVTLQTFFFLAFKKVFYSQIFYILRLFLILFCSYLIFFSNPKDLILFYSFNWLLSLFLFSLISYFVLWKTFPFLFNKFPKFEKNLLKKFIKYGFYGMFVGLGNMIISQIDIILITYFLTLSQVGIYSNAISTISILFLILTPISILFLPLFSEYKEKNNYSLMSKIVNILYTYGFYLILPFALIFYIYPQTLLTILFSKEFSSAFIILQILAIFSIFKILFQYNINFMIGLGMVKNTTSIVFGVAILNIIFDIIFLKLYGLIGVAIVTGFSWTLLFLLSLYFIKKEIDIKLNLIFFFKTILLGFFFVFLVNFLKGIISVGSYYLNIFLILSISFSFYFILGYLFKIYTIKDFYIFLPNKLKYLFEKYLPFLK